MDIRQPPSIRIRKNGPYIVSGNIELIELIIRSTDNDYKMIPGRIFPVGEDYVLCRCGQSKNMPFCDGSHERCQFDGTETASRKPYIQRAKILKGPNLILSDLEVYCSFSRFCHTVDGTAWDLTENSDNPIARESAIKAAAECPSGRLVAYDKATQKPIEITFKPSIAVLQDPQRGVSGPLWVRGGIPIESADGEVYEIRNRVTLCRCGQSQNKPYCDASHVSTRFRDMYFLPVAQQ